MPRRRKKRRRGRHSLAVLALVISAVLIAAYVWRALTPAHVPAVLQQPPSRAQQPRAPGPNDHEDFTATEREGLENALKGRGSGKQQ